MLSFASHVFLREVKMDELFAGYVGSSHALDCLHAQQVEAFCEHVGSGLTQQQSVHVDRDDFAYRAVRKRQKRKVRGLLNYSV
jgi:hypothetical protein